MRPRGAYEIAEVLRAQEGLEDGRVEALAALQLCEAEELLVVSLLLRREVDVLDEEAVDALHHRQPVGTHQRRGVGVAHHGAQVDEVRVVVQVDQLLLPDLRSGQGRRASPPRPRATRRAGGGGRRGARGSRRGRDEEASAAPRTAAGSSSRGTCSSQPPRRGIRRARGAAPREVWSRGEARLRRGRDGAEVRSRLVEGEQLVLAQRVELAKGGEAYATLPGRVRGRLCAGSSPRRSGRGPCRMPALKPNMKLIARYL